MITSGSVTKIVYASPTYHLKLFVFQNVVIYSRSNILSTSINVAYVAELYCTSIKRFACVCTQFMQSSDVYLWSGCPPYQKTGRFYFLHVTYRQP
jgi:hypothetical protein